MAVYGYTRVSTVRQLDEDESLDVQRRIIEGYALMHGLQFDEILVEEGVSGSVPLNERPAGADLLAKLKAGDVVIAAKLDRCFRSALDALNVVEQLKTRGIKLHLLDLGDVTGDSLSKLFLTMAAAFAEAERDRIRERITNVKADQKARGRYLGGKVPFGYEIGLNGGLRPNEFEQVAFRAMMAMRQEGKALRTIAAAMSDRGIKISHEGVAKAFAARSYNIQAEDDEGTPMTPGKWLSVHMERVGISDEALLMRLRELGYKITNSSIVSHWRKGAIPIPAEEILRLCRAMGFSEIRAEIVASDALKDAYPEIEHLIRDPLKERGARLIEKFRKIHQ